MKAIVKDLIKFIKKNIVLDYDNESLTEKLSKEYGGDIQEFSDLLVAELSTGKYNEILKKFDVYAPQLLKELKYLCKNDEECNYSSVFSSTRIGSFFPEKSDFRDLSDAFYYILNCDDTNQHLDAYGTMIISESLSLRGKLHLIHENDRLSLEILAGYDLDTLHYLIENHYEYCKNDYPERLKPFEGWEIYNDWLNNKIESNDDADEQDDEDFVSLNRDLICNTYAERINASTEEWHDIEIKLSENLIFKEMSLVKTIAKGMQNMSEGKSKQIAASDVKNVTASYLLILIHISITYEEFSFYSSIEDAIKGKRVSKTMKKEFQKVIVDRGLEENFWKYIRMVDDFVKEVQMDANFWKC